MRKIYKVENIDCANCAAEIERDIRRIPGIGSASLSFITGRLTVEFDGDESALREAIVKACRHVEPECVVR